MTSENYGPDSREDRAAARDEPPREAYLPPAVEDIELHEDRAETAPGMTTATLGAEESMRWH